MAARSEGFAVTPGQARWIVERMIAERRISAADVRALVSEMGQEIEKIERRLATLRGDVSKHPAPQQSTNASKARRPAKVKGHPRGRSHPRS